MLHKLRDPVAWTNASQLLKTVAAVVIAWALAAKAFGISQPFLAPWAALLAVNATVLGSVRRGAAQAGASVIGVLVAFGAGRLFGAETVALAAAVPVGLLLGSIRGLRAESTTAAATAIVVLTTGYSDDSGMLASRLLDTGIGIAVGLLINLAVWPPLRDRGAASAIDEIDDRIGRLLCDMAAGLQRDAELDIDGWIARTRELDEQTTAAWRVLGQAKESGKLNPRRATPRRMQAAEDFAAVLQRIEHAVAEARSMARTIGLSHIAPGDWDRAFRTRWLEQLERTGAAVGDAGAEALDAVHRALDDIAGDLDVGALPDHFWPVCGALLVNLRNIVEALGAVAEAQPVRVPRPAALPA
jgi:uncharacterized membrane protein YgaE (UPF0421/DUF939 family)